MRSARSGWALAHDRSPAQGHLLAVRGGCEGTLGMNPHPRIKTARVDLTIDPACRDLWDDLAQRLGLSRTGMLELAVEQLAQTKSPPVSPAGGLSKSNGSPTKATTSQGVYTP
jgi:hypothetical protein